MFLLLLLQFNFTLQCKLDKKETEGSSRSINYLYQGNNFAIMSKPYPEYLVPVMAQKVLLTVVPDTGTFQRLPVPGAGLTLKATNVPVTGTFTEVPVPCYFTQITTHFTKFIKNKSNCIFQTFGDRQEMNTQCQILWRYNNYGRPL